MNLTSMSEDTKCVRKKEIENVKDWTCVQVDVHRCVWRLKLTLREKNNICNENYHQILHCRTKGY